MPGTFASPWNAGVGLVVGSTSLGGTLIINSAGQVLTGTGTPTSASVAAGTNSVGVVTVTGPGSRWSANGELHFAEANGANATVNILDGGVIATGGGSGGIRMGYGTGVANVTVDGAGSLLSSSTSIDVGESGRSTLTLSNGGRANANSIRVGLLAGARGVVNIGAAVGAAAVAPGILGTTSVILNAGINSLLVLNHTDVSGGYVLSPLISGTGQVQVYSGTTVVSRANTYTGGTALNGGVLQVSSDANLGAAAGTLSFNGGTLRSTAGFSMARSTTLNASGGIFETQTGILPLIQNGLIAGVGALTKTGAGTLNLTAANTYTGGTAINGGVLQISSDSNLGAPAAVLSLDGGTLRTTANIAMARDTTLGSAGGTFETQTSNLTQNSSIAGVGALTKAGSGTLTLTSANTYTGGTTISAGTLQLGNGGTSGSIVGNVTDNAALVFNRSDSVTVASNISGSGTVSQIGTGTTVLTGTNTYTGGTTISAGTLQLGNGGTSGSVVGNITDNATLAFDRSDTFNLAGVISGSGSVSQIGTGSTVLSGANTYVGATTVSAGTLYVDGNQSAATGLTSVASGATLGGSGTIGGSVNIADGGTLSPGDQAAPGRLGINGDLGLSTGSLLNYRFGQAGVVGGPLNDLTVVGGNLTLDGTLNVTTSPGGTFTPGVYRVISYGGTLTNNGLLLGTTPSGTTLGVQTSVANQVNLVNTTGLTLNFWDGNAGPKNDATVNGGNGVWQNNSGNDNWTDSNGTVNAPFSNGSFAVFMAQPGTVSIDNSLGQVNVSGMQFASDGYVISGGPLELIGSPTSIIRVGDGTASGAADTATINSVLTGSSSIQKEDLGTLVLTANNTYTGGTAINGGVLQISSDNNLGTPAAALSLDGGTLRTTADMTMARDTTLGSAGGTFETQASILTQNSSIAGVGALTKAGTGTLTLTSANTYSGGTTISAGTLQLGDGGTSGSIVGDVTDNAALAFNRSDSVTVASNISGSGTVSQIGAGTTVLTGTSTYTGGTTISAGTLQLGNGGTSGSIVGNVTDNAALAFDRSDTLTLAGVISGSGSVFQIGTGSTVLSGANAYAGATTVAAGALYVDGNQSAATGLASVASGATLGGSGTLGGNVDIADGGTLSPGDPGSVPGRLTINGDLGLSTGSLLDYRFGQAGIVGGALNDLTVVGGNLTLDGSLNVTTPPGGTFIPGIYRVISYGGTLANNGLALGTTPLGTTLNVQTSVANQVNLVNSTGLTLRFWDGVAGPKNDGAVNGGNGLWQNVNGNDNWTDADGAVNAPFTDAAFAVFMAQPGAVSVDNSLGQVNVSGMQFASDGYVISGGSLALVGSPTSIIRVGDGTASGAADTATINSVLTGSSSIQKEDLGTLVLTANNTYTGGNAINGGVLQVSSNNNLGASAAALSLDGGTLRTTADITMARDTTLGSAGGAFETQASKLTQNSSIAGIGALTKAGSGTLTLTSANTYTGGTTISAGTLQLGNGGTGGSIVGNVTNNAALAFDRSDINNFAGVISGTGSVAQIGTGTTLLSGTNTYIGLTTVATGTLQAGASNAFSAASMHTVQAGATLDTAGFNQTVAALQNNGTVSLVSAIPGSTLTVNGPYVGNNATLRLGTDLGGDASLSDRLVLNGPTANASGSTTLQIANLGGLGALTSGNGIEVVSALNGATTTAQTTKNAFSLANGHVDAGAYEYRLYAADATGSGENWYLRSSSPVTTPGSPPLSPAVPTYRSEVPLLAALPAQSRQADLAMLGNLHRRVGDEFNQGDSAAPTSDAQALRSWGRAVYTDLDIQQPGDADAHSQGHVSGWQVGNDLFVSDNWRSGFYVGFLDGNADVSGNAHGVTGRVGNNKLQTRYLGAYATWMDSSGTYVDSVLQGGSQDYTVRPDGNQNISGNYHSFAASVETGKTFTLTEQWSLEPQAQLIFQQQNQDDLTLGGAQVNQNAENAWIARLGARVKGEFVTGAGKLLPYARVNLYHSSAGNDDVTFSTPTASTKIESPSGYSAAEAEVGGTLALTSDTSLYGEIGQLWNIGGDATIKSSVQASLGLKMRW
ncbi:autotransporter-associated beta strand repeat-containing protein [Pseudomonas arsenicoxydans]|uniref:autotransporter-associated beta strand repeat-containing protein n=1 Tax=Pseudomonas arsenicoxydans TaxID=702115 RepID=UPI001375D550|nr:autotransporter-associated beta strand repeat-containing protein [Pseudomonas arsenicoxydans]